MRDKTTTYPIGDVLVIDHSAHWDDDGETVTVLWEAIQTDGYEEMRAQMHRSVEGAIEVAQGWSDEDGPEYHHYRVLSRRVLA